MSEHTEPLTTHTLFAHDGADGRGIAHMRVKHPDSGGIEIKIDFFWVDRSPLVRRGLEHYADAHAKLEKLLSLGYGAFRFYKLQPPSERQVVTTDDGKQITVFPRTTRKNKPLALPREYHFWTRLSFFFNQTELRSEDIQRVIYAMQQNRFGSFQAQAREILKEWKAYQAEHPVTLYVKKSDRQQSAQPRRGGGSQSQSRDNRRGAGDSRGDRRQRSDRRGGGDRRRQKRVS